MKLRLLSLTILTSCLAIASGSKAAQSAQMTEIANGLDQPRGITFDAHGNLYVSETGKGGDGNCQPSPSTLFLPICAGKTSSLIKITPDGQQQPIIDGFDSLAQQPSGYEGAGIQALEFDSQGNAYMITGFAGFPGNRDEETSAIGANIELPDQQLAIFPPSPIEQVLNTPSLGQLYKVDLNTGELTSIFDFAKYELLNNPDGSDVVTNPYAMAIKDDTAYIADGGGNTLYQIKLDGSDVKAISIPGQTIDNPVFPPLPPGQEAPAGSPEASPPPQLDIQSVPTGIAIGPDGAAYVGEYTGYPYPEGKAKIWRVGDDGKPEVYAEGFTHITDMKFDADGNLYVLQFSDQSQWKGEESKLPGSLIKVAPDGTRTTVVAAGEGLESADGLAISHDNQIYVVNHGIGPGNGQILRIDSFDDVEAVP